MKVRVIVPQSGLYNGAPWPIPGEEIDLPDHVAESMIAVGHVEDAKKKASPEAQAAAEQAEAEQKAAEAAREADLKAAAEAAQVETRPAPTDDVETPEQPKKAVAKKTVDKS